VDTRLSSSFPDSLSRNANGTNPQTMHLSLTQFVEAEDMSIMTKRSTETAKCQRDGGLYSIVNNDKVKWRHLYSIVNNDKPSYMMSKMKDKAALLTNNVKQRRKR
jgi:hypothetical protein